ncbi:hypothetical protein LTR66_014710 [Elasticomyces elasticus]|nr:hypothetical protein LTR66_014710 [Elasticomyces elasticus]
MACNLITRLFRRNRRTEQEPRVATHPFIAPALTRDLNTIPPTTPTEIKHDLQRLSLSDTTTNTNDCENFELLGMLSEQGSYNLLALDVPTAYQERFNEYIEKLPGFTNYTWNYQFPLSESASVTISFATSADARMARAAQLQGISVGVHGRRALQYVEELQIVGCAPVEPSRKRMKLTSKNAPIIVNPTCGICMEEIKGPYESDDLTIIRVVEPAARTPPDAMRVQHTDEFGMVTPNIPRQPRQGPSNDDLLSMASRLDEHAGTPTEAGVMPTVLPEMVADGTDSYHGRARVLSTASTTLNQAVSIGTAERPHMSVTAVAESASDVVNTPATVGILNHNETITTSEARLVAVRIPDRLESLEFTSPPAVTSAISAGHENCPHPASPLLTASEPVDTAAGVIRAIPSAYIPDFPAYVDSDDDYISALDLFDDIDERGVGFIAHGPTAPAQSSGSTEEPSRHTDAIAAADHSQPEASQQPTEPAATVAIAAAPIPAADNQNLDAESADEWEARLDLDFGEEPLDESWDTWGCYHRFNSIFLSKLSPQWLPKPDILDDEAVATKSVDCLRCYKPIILEDEASRKAKDAEFRKSLDAEVASMSDEPPDLDSKGRPKIR